jgi:CHAP domain
VCWCLGISRKTDHKLYKQFNGGWINTDAIVHDADTSTGFFYKIDSPKVGAIVVYPSRKPDRKYGHVGIVTEINQDKISKVIHCSSTNYKDLGDAISETDAGVFTDKGAIFAWYNGFV